MPSRSGALIVGANGIPSSVARPPLSLVKMTSVLSLSFSSSSFFSRRPTLASMLSTIAAYTGLLCRPCAGVTLYLSMSVCGACSGVWTA